MTRLVKIVDNKYVQIEEYRNPNICFDTNEYSDFENYCTLRETFDPFRMFYENKKLQEQLLSNTLQLEELKKQLEKKQNPLQGIFAQVNDDMLLRNCGAMQSEIDEYKTQQKEFIKWLEDIINTYIYSNLDDYKNVLQKYKEIIGDDK